MIIIKIATKKDCHIKVKTTSNRSWFKKTNGITGSTMKEVEQKIEKLIKS